MEWGPCTPLGRGPAAHAREDLPSLKVGLRGKQVGKHGGRGSRANPAAGQVGKAERKWIQTQETGLRNCNQGWGHFCSQKAWGPRGEPCRQRTKSKEGDGQIGAWVSRWRGGAVGRSSVQPRVSKMLQTHGCPLCSPTWTEQHLLALCQALGECRGVSLLPKVPSVPGSRHGSEDRPSVLPWWYLP